MYVCVMRENSVDKAIMIGNFRVNGNQAVKEISGQTLSKSRERLKEAVQDPKTWRDLGPQNRQAFFTTEGITSS